MSTPTSQIERDAHRLWFSWGGAWARHTVCSDCGEARYCGARHRRGPYLCVECFDQSEHAARLLTRDGR